MNSSPRFLVLQVSAPPVRSRRVTSGPSRISLSPPALHPRQRPQHFLYFLPLPQRQGALRPTFFSFRLTGAGAASPPWL